MTLRSGIVAFLALVLSHSAGVGSPRLSEESPFLPKGGTARPAASQANPSFAFVGAVEQGATTLISIRRSSDQHSVWIPVGSTVNGMTAQSYDPVSEQAVIIADGRAHTLQLRRPTAASRASGPEPTGRPRRDAMEPVDPDNDDESMDPETEDSVETDDTDEEVTETEEPESEGDESEESSEDEAADPDDAGTEDEESDPDSSAEAREEYEARMLVSDLLDLGRKQRAAYEATHRGAQGGTAVHDEADSVDFSEADDEAEDPADDDPAYDADDADLDEVDNEE